jgi:hypothetical protein
MSQENVEVIRRAVEALNDRDVNRYLACCTEDVALLPPTSAIEGAYEGVAGVRRFLADVQEAMPDFRLDIERLESIGSDRMLVSLHATMSGRTTGIGADLQITNIYDLAGGKIRRVQVFPDRDQALSRRAAGVGDVAGERGGGPPQLCGLRERRRVGGPRQRRPRHDHVSG